MVSVKCLVVRSWASSSYPRSSPKWIRGAVVSCYQFAITIGLLLASIVDNATKGRGGNTCWRIPISIQFVWAAILCFGMIFLPEVCVSAGNFQV